MCNKNIHIFYERCYSSNIVALIANEVQFFLLGVIYYVNRINGHDGV
jgi:hypothetical protein